MASGFRDQVVLITGGGRGIGRATALEFAKEGARLVLAGRKWEALRTASAEVGAAGGRADVIKCDVSKDDDLLALVEKTLRKRKRIDVLINNAGVVSVGRLDEIDAADVRRMVDVNVWATIRLTQLVLPHMRAVKGGTIVNISSVAGRMGMPFFATYCASKFAVRGFSEAMRRELRPDRIHVMAVYPGLTSTDMMDGIQIEGMGAPVSTPERVGAAIVRGVRRRSPDVFIDIAESLLSGWNEFLPWTVDYGMELMRDRVQQASRQHRTT